MPAAKFTLNHLKNKLVFGFGLLLAISGLAFTSSIGLQKVSAADCDSNAIIYCGTGNASQFIAQVKANDSKNGHHDLQTVYAHYGLEPASYDQFVKTARAGTLYNDGRLVVDGLQVAQTNTNTIGRNAGSQGVGYFTTNIGGTNYYGNATGATFAAGTQSIPVMAMFNAKGVLQFAVLTACGNPVGNTPTTPNYSCNSLQKVAVSGKLNTYNFTTATTAGNGATIAKVVYNFGDGTSVTATNPKTPVPHTYTKAGNFTAKVTVYVNLPGAQQTTVVSGDCQMVITVVLPLYQCLATTALLADSSNKYRYTINTTTKAASGATLAKVAYNFGDGGTSTSTTGATTHTYTKAGTFTIKATAYFTVVGSSSQVTATSVTCQKKVTVVNPFYSCTQLSGSILDKTTFSYQFVASADYGNGATPTTADFNFGDGKTTTGVKLNGKTFTTNYSYAKAGNYDIAATLHFTVNGKAVTAPACKALVTPTTPPTPECKPGVPVGSSECSPCQYDSTLPSDSPQCVAPVPPELPNTGAGDVVAVFGVVAVAGFLIYRQLLFRKHKSAFAAAQAGTSPLPLGQPLDDEAPLAGTPLAPKRRSLRRNKPF